MEDRFRLPLVSILITVFNGELYLSTCLNSLLSQTYTDLELIVVDDGSDDGTPFILNRMAESDSRVKVHFPGRIGRARALNYGLSKSNGDFIAINDTDDYSKPDRIEKQVNFMIAHPEIGLLGSAKEVHDRDKVWKDQVPITDKEIKRAFALGQPIQHSTVMFRKSVLEEVGGYNERIPFLLDRDIFIRVGRISKLHQLADHLIILNRSSNQYFRNKYKGIQRNWMSTRYQLKAVAWFRLSPLLYMEIIAKFIYGNINQIFKSKKI